MLLKNKLMAEDFGCSDCAKKQERRALELEEMTDEEWNREFPTFTGRRANVYNTCESCQ